MADHDFDIAIRDLNRYAKLFFSLPWVDALKDQRLYH